MYLKLALAVTFIALAATPLCAQQETLPSQSQPSDAAKPAASDATTAPVSHAATKEDWTTISLAKSGLATNQIGGTLLNKVDLPAGCSRELVHLQWRPADPIDLYVIRPLGVDKPPVTLFLLNYTFDTAIFRTDYWCSQAKEKRLAIVGFGSALSWQRFHTPRLMKQWFVSELQEALSTSAHDVQMILNYLESRKDLDMTRIGMYGQGSGGAIAILTAAADPRITALDVTDPWGDWPDWLKGSQQIPEDERASYLKPEFLQKVASLDPVNYLPQLKVRSLRIQQVLSDPVTPTAAKNKIAGAAPKPADVIRYPDAAAQHKAVFLGGVTEWLAKQLNSETTMASGVR